MHSSLFDLGVVSLDLSSQVFTSPIKLYEGNPLWLVRYDQKRLFIGCNFLLGGPFGMIQESHMCPFRRGMQPPWSQVEGRAGRV